MSRVVKYFADPGESSISVINGKGNTSFSMARETNQQNTVTMVNGLVALVQKHADMLDTMEQVKQQLGSHVAESRIRHKMVEQRLHNVTRDIGRLEGEVNRSSIPPGQGTVMPTVSNAQAQPS